MGGHGSGRKPSTETLIKQSRPDTTPIGDGLFLPNVSAVQDAALKTSSAIGGGSMTTVKEGGTQLGGADIITLDFLGADFDLTESPDKEVNIVIADAGIDHDATTNFDANEHFLQSAITEVGTIATGTWEGTTIALNQGGTGETTATPAFDALAPTTTKGDLIVSDGTDNIREAIGTDDQVLTADSAQTSGMKWAAAAGGGKILQVVNTQTGAVATTTTQVPFDDTIPQKTEGGEFMTLAITPANTNNILIIQTDIQISHGSADRVNTAALFQDTTADALSVAWQHSENAGTLRSMAFTHKMTAGTASATTFKVRCGANNSGTTSFNGQSGNRKMGGKLSSSITITEVEA